MRGLLSQTHTIIVGAGIIGVSCAYFLARRGHPVTVVERREIGSGASSGNAGIIAFGHPPLPRPGLVGKVLRWMLDGGSPLYMPLRLDPSLVAWFWRFRRACTEDHFRACMKELSALGRLSHDCFEEIMSDDGMECEYHRQGWREVFRTEAGLADGVHDAELLRDHGFDVEVLDGTALTEREPGFVDGLAGAVEYRQSAFTDPAKFLDRLARLAMKHGAVFRTNTQIVDVTVESGRVSGARLDTGERVAAGSVVLAAGIWSTALARRVGLCIPMQAGKGYHRNITRPQPGLRVASVLAEKHVAVTPMAGALRLSGTVEFSGINHRMVRKRLDMLTAGARDYLRGVGQTQTVSEWCGLRPCTADGLPVIGWAARPAGLFVATGHARMGLTLGPGTGRLVAESVLHEAPSLDLSPYAVARFS